MPPRCRCCQNVVTRLNNPTRDPLPPDIFLHRSDPQAQTPSCFLHSCASRCWTHIPPQADHRPGLRSLTCPRVGKVVGLRPAPRSWRTASATTARKRRHHIQKTLSRNSFFSVSLAPAPSSANSRLYTGHRGFTFGQSPIWRSQSAIRFQPDTSIPYWLEESDYRTYQEDLNKGPIKYTLL